jgi:hypothetical protein
LGPYDNGLDYAVGDIVTYNGGTYYRTGEPNPGYSPETSYWSIIAQPGADGTQGPEGTAGPQGEQGIQGESGLLAVSSPLVYEVETKSLSLDEDALVLNERFESHERLNIMGAY